MAFRRLVVHRDERRPIGRAGSNKTVSGPLLRRWPTPLLVVAVLVAVGVAGGSLIAHITATPSHVIPSGNASSRLKSAASPTQPTPADTPATAAPAQSVVPHTAKAAPQVLTIGDSIMKGFGLPAAQAWPALIAAKNGWDLATLACNGAGFLTIGSAQDCDDNFLGVVGAAAALHPDIVIISGSSNDFGEENTALLDTTVAALARLRAEFPNAEIIGLSTIWGDTALPAQLAQIDAQVAQAAEQVGGTYLDVGQPLSGHPELMQADDVHPTAAGQFILGAAIQGA